MDFLISHQKFKVKNPKYVQTQMDLALLLLLDSTKNYCNFAKCPTFEGFVNISMDKMRTKVRYLPILTLSVCSQNKLKGYNQY